MKFEQIMDKAQYQSENYKPFADKILEINVEDNGGHIKTLNNEKDFIYITQTAMDQLLERIHVKQAIKCLSRFKDDSTTQQSLFEPTIKYSKKEKIIGRIIDLGISQSDTLQFIKDENLGQVVGVVGKGYKFYPQWKVIEESEKVYGSQSDNNGMIDPRFSYINDKKMKLYYSLPKVHETPINNERMIFGYNIGNSQTGHSSVHVYNNAIFEYCTNGVIFNEVNLGFWKSHRVALDVLFPQNLRKVKDEDLILNLIDRYINQPSIYSVDSLTNPVKLAKLNGLLKRFGIPTKEHRKEVVQILKKENKDMNSYNVGSAVNYYASNVLNDAILSHQLLRPAYEIMSIQN